MLIKCACGNTKHFNFFCCTFRETVQIECRRCGYLIEMNTKGYWRKGKLFYRTTVVVLRTQEDVSGGKP